MSAPNPLVMQKFAPKPAEAVPTFVPPVVVITADLNPADPGKIVRPGLTDKVTYSNHDGVVKAKNLVPGMVVRSWLHGAPCGSEKIIKTVERIDDGAMVRIDFASKHPSIEVKAAYRFHCEALVGTLVRNVKKVPALVAYEEI